MLSTAQPPSPSPKRKSKKIYDSSQHLVFWRDQFFLLGVVVVVDVFCRDLFFVEDYLPTLGINKAMLRSVSGAFYHLVIVRRLG